MKRMTQKKLNKVLDAHEAWLRMEKKGKRAMLCGKNMSGLDFSGRKLRHACMAHSVLMYANLRGADFSDAILIDAIMLGADAENAVFWNAHLTSANLLDANLQNADFTQAIVVGILLTEANTKGAIWDDAVRRYWNKPMWYWETEFGESKHDTNETEGDNEANEANDTEGAEQGSGCTSSVAETEEGRDGCPSQ
jgi:hypothetical protein